ncbi:unnamed protein product [Rotaria sp. Silwood2]
MVEQILEFNNDLQIQDNFIDPLDDNELSHHHKVPSILDEHDWNDMAQIIQNMDSKPGMTFAARQFAQQHKRNILSLRHQLTEEKLIMRASYKGYSFHTYPAKEYQQKSSNYIKQLGIYKFINDVKSTNPKVSQQCLKNIIQEVNTTLNMLLNSKNISDQQYVLMHPNSSIIRLNYLHFVPDTTKETDSLQPIIICKNGPTFNLAHYLSDILWSIFNQIASCKTFANSDDIVYTLEQYVKHGYLHETTHFVAFNINDICTKFSHEKAIKALENFLNMHSSELQKITEGLTNKTIFELVRLVLQNQYFIYENKLYQQIHGGASGSLLTIPLACIYLFYGQSSILIHTLINNKNGLFGRYRDDIFLTWNDSKDEFYTFINGVMNNQQQHPSIPLLQTMIGTTVHLLDLELTNDKGHFITKIYHDPQTDEYELPSKYEYHTNRPSNLLKAALKHAVRCCSNQEDFHKEHRHIDLCHLIRGFSPDFIDQCIKEFYKELDITIDIYHLFNTIPYETLRQCIIDIYEKEIILKKEQQAQKQNIIRILYPDDWTEQMAIKIKDDLLVILKENSTNKEAFNNIKFEFVPRPQTPLTINDYLVDRRPPLSMLTLPNR